MFDVGGLIFHVRMRVESQSRTSNIQCPTSDDQDSGQRFQKAFNALFVVESSRFPNRE